MNEFNSNTDERSASYPLIPAKPSIGFKRPSSRGPMSNIEQRENHLLWYIHQPAFLA